MAINGFNANSGAQLMMNNGPMNFQNGAGGVNQGGASGENGGDDQANISGEANKTDEGMDKQRQAMMYEMQLQTTLSKLESAQESQDEDAIGQALHELDGQYSEVQQKGIQISKETEAAVKQALGIGEADEDLGGKGGNLDALNEGGFNANDGGRGANSNGYGQGFGGGGGGGGGGIPPKKLTEEDKKFLNEPPVDQNNSHLTDTWRQGPDGNCSTVAAIKAAMDRYGENVFDSVKNTGNGYDIVMQDGYKMKMSNAELQAAKQAAQFRGQDGPGKSYATFLYGAVAKRNALDNGMSLGQSFQDLNNGESIYSPAKSLGLWDQVVPVNPQNLNGQDSVVAGSSSHAVFVNKNRGGGHVTDLWGRRLNFNGTDGKGGGLINAYTFKPRRSSFGGGGPRSAAPSTSSVSTRSSFSGSPSVSSRPTFTRTAPTTRTRTVSRRR